MDISEVIVQYGQARISGYIGVASYTALVYHYFTTVDQEVSHIWPQPRWKLGKILFLTTRYAAMVAMAQDLVANLPTHAVISVIGCDVIARTTNIAIVVTHFSAEGTLWVCLYALMEGKKRHFYILVIVFLAFSIPIQILQGFATMTQEAFPLDPLTEALGFPCSFYPPNYMNLYSIATYLAVARNLVALIMGLYAFTVRYRKQKNALIRVIKREGGMYFLSTLVLKFFEALKATPKSPIKDKYTIIWSLNWFCVNVFAERLLLLLKKIDHPGTQAVVSELMFAGEKTRFTTEDFEESRDTVYESTGELSTSRVERVGEAKLKEPGLALA